VTISIDMLPARQGDALWVEYGDRPHRLLVDGGVAETWERLKSRIEALPREERHFELLLVSHIDLDHINGVLSLLKESASLGATFGDVWFNGYRHLPDTDVESFGPVQGERLTRSLLDCGLPWNEAFGRAAVAVLDDEEPPARVLAGGLAVTVLSPYPAQLERLRPVWAETVTEANLNPNIAPEPPVPLPEGVESYGAPPSVAQLVEGRFEPDSAPANGTSIALLLEFGGRAVILAADAYPDVLRASVERLLRQRAVERLRLDAFKLPHHGSRKNVNLELLEMLECPLYLFSTDGTQTRHPHPEAVARVLVTAGAPTLAFNYRTEFNSRWLEPASMDRYGYAVRCPAANADGLAVTV
jgi:Metallo-beta-lactamase superfamily